MNHSEFITVYNDAGKKVELELIDVVKLGSDEYVIAGPKDSNEAYAYKAVKRSASEVEYMSIGAGAEFNRVLAKFNSQDH